MMMGYYSGTLYVLFGLDFLLTCVFSDCIGFFEGNGKGGVYICMRKGTFFFVLMVSLFLPSSHSRIYIYTYLISITQ